MALYFACIVPYEFQQFVNGKLINDYLNLKSKRFFEGLFFYLHIKNPMSTW